MVRYFLLCLLLIFGINLSVSAQPLNCGLGKIEGLHVTDVMDTSPPYAQYEMRKKLFALIDFTDTCKNSNRRYVYIEQWDDSYHMVMTVLAMVYTLDVELRIIIDEDTFIDPDIGEANGLRHASGVGDTAYRIEGIGFE